MAHSPASRPTSVSRAAGVGWVEVRSPSSAIPTLPALKPADVRCVAHQRAAAAGAEHGHRVGPGPAPLVDTALLVDEQVVADVAEVLGDRVGHVDRADGGGRGGVGVGRHGVVHGEGLDVEERGGEQLGAVGTEPERLVGLPAGAVAVAGAVTHARRRVGRHRAPGGRPAGAVGGVDRQGPHVGTRLRVELDAERAAGREERAAAPVVAVRSCGAAGGDGLPRPPARRRAEPDRPAGGGAGPADRQVPDREARLDAAGGTTRDQCGRDRPVGVGGKARLRGGADGHGRGRGGEQGRREQPASGDHGAPRVEGVVKATFRTPHALNVAFQAACGAGAGGGSVRATEM